MKVNFKKFSMYTGISKKEKVTGDSRESFADILYTRCDGVRAKSLAMKIYESDGDMEFTEEDINFLRLVVHAYCTPAFIDGFEEQLNKEDQ